MNRKILAVLLALLLVLLVSVVACGKKAEQQTQGTGDQTTTTPAPTKTIKVGFIMPMSGPGSLWGEQIKKDTDAFAAVINDEGGLKIGGESYNVETYYADDQGLPENALAAATELVSKDGVSVITGYWGGGLSSINTVTAPAKVLTIFTNSTNYEAKTMPYTVIDSDNAYFAIPELQAMLKAFPKTKKVGISGPPTYVDIVFGNNMMDQYKEILNEYNIGFFEDTYPYDATDFTQHVEKLKQAGVDLIHAAAPPTGYAGVLKQMHEVGYKAQYVIAGSIPDLKSFINLSGYEAAQGAMATASYPWVFKNTKVDPDVLTTAMKIKDKHKELYNEEINYDGGFTYGANQMLIYFQAMKKAGTTDPDAVMMQIEGGTLETFLGSTTFGGAKTFGRAVFSPTFASMGTIKDYHVEYAYDVKGDLLP